MTEGLHAAKAASCCVSQRPPQLQPWLPTTGRKSLASQVGLGRFVPLAAVALLAGVVQPSGGVFRLARRKEPLRASCFGVYLISSRSA